MSGEPDVVRQAVVDAVSAVLRVDPATVLAAASLADLPAFNSFRIVDIVERVEEALGVEPDPAALTPENLHRLDRLCDIFRQSTPSREA